MDDELMVWGVSTPKDALSELDAAYLYALSQRPVPDVEWIWSEMDRVWMQLALDNRKPLAPQRVAEFYSHPVWIANALFTLVDPESIGHRAAIANWVSALGANRVAEYGGGGCALAKRICAAMPKATIDVIEPYASAWTLAQVRGIDNLRLRPDLSGTYDLVIAQDVLEHLEEPLDVVGQIAGSLRLGGHAVFANCFYPVIECHLPGTFYLRHTFRFLLRGFSLRFVGSIQGARHALIFEKTHDRRLPRVLLQVLVGAAKILGPVVNATWALVKTARSRKVE